MPPASAVVSGTLAQMATVHQPMRVSPPSARHSRHNPDAVSSSHNALTAPRASAPARSCGTAWTTSANHGARAQT